MDRRMFRKVGRPGKAELGPCGYGTHVVVLNRDELQFWKVVFRFGIGHL
jgi:hypothetical protein